MPNALHNVATDVQNNGNVQVLEEELQKQMPRRRLRYAPLNYELLVWVCFGTFTLLAVVDRFVWNVWPRQMYTIGTGSAGSDFTDGLKPGPWAVKFYDAVARISGRYSIVALNLLLFTMMKTSMNFVAESWIARHVVDFTDSVEGNRRLHKWNGIAIAVWTLLHVWSILFPCIVHGWNAEVILGSFEWILSERGPKGFKDINNETKTMGLQGDDVFRIVEMTILLAILLPLSVRWLHTRWHLGIHLHNIINVLYFIDIVRRHTHPHSWILNTPFFVAWIVDSVIGSYWRRSKPLMHRQHLSEDYMLLFSDERKTLETVGPKYYLRLVRSSLLERAHVFTAFENRQGLNLCEGKPWTTCLLIRVYHSKRTPRLGRKDKVSHTQRVAEAADLQIYQWGPFLGSMSDRVKISLDGRRAVTLIAGGSAAGYLIDAIQLHTKYQPPYLTILYTCADAGLFEWVVRVFEELLEKDSHFNLNVSIALTGQHDDDRRLSALFEDKDRFIGRKVSQDSFSSQSDEPMKPTRISLNRGRFNFYKTIPDDNIVYFQGSGGLQTAVKKACKVRKCGFVAGPAYDQNPAKKKFFLKGLVMNCLRKEQDFV